MPEYRIQKYSYEHREAWDQFVGKAKNATFLFCRDFMDYHSDRFEDFSLMVFKKNKLVSIFPANRVGEKVYSHQGLSYGGILISKKTLIQEYVQICETLMEYCREAGVNSVFLKAIPVIFTSPISQDLDVILFYLKARLYRVDSYLVVDNRVKYKPNRNRKRALVKATHAGLEVKKSDDLATFWEKLLIPNLQERFGAKPTHTLFEIELLKVRFPESILFYGAYDKEELKAGAVIFVMKDVIHFQYSSGDDERYTGALDLLFDYIVREYSYKNYISFGNSSEEEGSKINSGLAYWKESFGANSLTQNYYEIETRNHEQLKNRFV